MGWLSRFAGGVHELIGLRFVWRGVTKLASRERVLCPARSHRGAGRPTLWRHVNHAAEMTVIFGDSPAMLGVVSNRKLPFLCRHYTLVPVNLNGDVV